MSNGGTDAGPKPKAEDGAQEGSGGMVWMCVSLSLSLVFLGLVAATLGREIPAVGSLVAAGLFAIAGAIAKGVETLARSGRAHDVGGQPG